MGKLKDISGQRFGRLVVTHYAGHGKYHCVCDCGKEVDVLRANLVKGRQRSCGCYADECRVINNTTHGGSKTKLYKVWRAMRNRCENPNNKSYKFYGERGISVCDEWKTFAPFQDWARENGYHEGLQIDRIDNYRGYSPDNCRWVTQKENKNNKRNTIFVEYEGKTVPITVLAETHNMSRNTLYCRIHDYGFTAEEAVTLPVKIGNNQELRKNGKHSNL